MNLKFSNIKGKDTEITLTGIEKEINHETDPQRTGFFSFFIKPYFDR